MPPRKTDEELVDEYMHGTVEKQYTSVVARGKRFVIFKTRGHHYWSDIMNPSAYAPVEHVLIRQGEWCLRGKKIKEWEGRVSKKVLLAALEEAEKCSHPSPSST